MGSLVLIAHFNLYLSSLHSYEKIVDTCVRYPRMTMPEGQSCTKKYLKRRWRAKDSTTPNIVGSCCDRVGSGVRTDATTLNDT